MRLRQWAKLQGVSYKTALRWFHSGNLPVKAKQLATGTILVEGDAIIEPYHGGGVALYARVSGSDQKKDLEAQLGRLMAFANSRRFTVVHAATEVGSGLNGHRPKLIKLLADPTATTIIVEHRDRLMRFGSEYVEAALKAQGRQLLVIDKAEVKDDLVQDMIEVLTSFCARLYGRSSARRRAEKAVAVVQNND